MEDKEHGISMHGHRTRINHDNIKSAILVEQLIRAVISWPQLLDALSCLLILAAIGCTSIAGSEQVGPSAECSSHSSALEVDVVYVWDPLGRKPSVMPVNKLFNSV